MSVRGDVMHKPRSVNLPDLIKIPNFNGRQALLCLPAFALILIYGLLSGKMLEATVAAGGSLSVGFGAVQAFSRWRSAPMLAAAIGMSISAFVGSLAGNDLAILLAVSFVWAGLCALLSSIDKGAWWILLQWAIALFVAGNYPETIDGAAHRAMLVLAGGALQCVLVLAGWYLTGPPAMATAHHGVVRIRRALALAVQGRLPALRHTVRAAISVVLATAVVHIFAVPHGYWAPMTALIVLKANLQETRSRGLMRLSGTIGGGAIASLVGVFVSSDAVTLLAALACAWLAFALQKSHYTLFTFAVTATIVFMLALDHDPEIETAWYRLLATLIGGGIALLAAYLANIVFADRQRQVGAG